MSTEAVLKLIIDKLDGLENKFNGMENKLDGLENRFNDMENKLDSLENRFNSLENRFNGLEKKLDGMEKRIEAVFEQTAMLTEFKTETEAALAEINRTIENKYDLILRDIELVAGEQGKQRIDIARLKAVIGER